MTGGVSKLNPDGSDAKFEVTDHLGIDLNRAKINRDGAGSGTGPNGKYGIFGFVTYATPATEPQLFANGNEIRDCWVFKTRRVGIIAAGNGLIVDGNVVRDRAGKIAFIRANGVGCETNNSATHENRGIDVSGWNVTLTRNDIEVRRHTIGGPAGYGSVDGEGVLVQECCGGTSVKDYSFKFNKLTQASSGYIGLWKMRTMYNVNIDSNDLGCKNIYLTANTNGASFGLYNSTINGNTNLDGIQSNADLGGNNLVISGNSFCGTGVINAPGFATVTNNGGATFNPGPGTVVAVPNVSILSPANGEEFDQFSPLLLSALATDADSVQFFVNSTPLTGYQASSATTLPWTWYPDFQPGTYYITMRAKNANGVTWSNTVQVVLKIVGSAGKSLPSIPVFAYPNPSNGQFQISFPGTEGIAAYEILDFTGKLIETGNLRKENPIVNLSSYPAGLYQMKLTSKNASGLVRLVKN
jgi:hypothetical protein